ncbi:MAG: hypothetical protein Q7N50_09905 [Armatimonadota bacterium]|nr:hypothetical protein [Armatimonadota bacterium]
MNYRRVVPLVALAITMSVISAPVSAIPGYLSRTGTIKHALLQPDGTAVQLDAVIVDKIKAQQEPPYFVIHEVWDFNSRIVVKADAPSALRMGQTVDIEGVLGTLSNGVRSIENVKIIGYFDSIGSLILSGPVRKGYSGPTPWQYKAELGGGAGVSSLSASPLDAGTFPTPTPDPLPPPGFYSTIADLLADNPPGANDGLGISLQCKRVVSVGTDATYGKYMILGEDSSPETLKAYYSQGVNATDRVNIIVGQIRTVGSSIVLCVDSGPGYDPQAYRGNIQPVVYGNIGFARTLLDEASVTITGKIAISEKDLSTNAFYVEDPNRGSGIRVVYTGAETIAIGATMDVTGNMNTAADGEREILANSVNITSPSGQAPMPLGINMYSLGGQSFNVRTPGVNVPSEAAGLYNVGSLVKTWGRVTSVDKPSQIMYVDDGAAHTNGDGPIGVKVVWAADGTTAAAPAVGDYLMEIVGISGLEARGSGQYARILRIRKINIPVLQGVSQETGAALSWTTQDYASYRLYRSASDIGPFELIASPAQGSYFDGSLANGTYYYKVSAVVAGIEGASSNVVAVTLGPPPPPPDNILPITEVSLAGEDSNGWFRTDVIVTLTAMDNHGVAATKYSLDGGAAWNDYAAPFTLTESKVATVYSIDTSDNEEFPHEHEVKIDKLAPTSAASISGNQQNGWYKGDVVVTLSAVDSEGGSGVESTEYDMNDNLWRPYTQPFTINQSGITVFRVRSKDNAGNQEEPVLQAVNIDNLPPIAIISLAGNQQNGWFNTDVVATIGAMDNEGGSGVWMLEYDLGDGNWMPYLGPITLTQEGPAVIRARATDNAYNQGLPVQQDMLIDKTAPITSIGLTGDLQNNWYVGDATVTLTALDNEGGSGLQTVLFDFNDSNWQPYTGSFVISQEGVTIVRALSIDNANNEEAAVQQEVKIDKTPPVVSISLEGGLLGEWYNSNVVVTVTTTDNDGGSGLQTVEYDFNDENWQPYIGPFTVSQDGITNVRARAKDNANNQSVVVQQEIKIDKAPPSTAISLSGTQQSGWYNTDVVVTITPVDNEGGSGIKRIEYDLNDDNWLVYTEPFTLSNNGSTIVRSRAIDNADNQSVPVQQLVKIDKIAPTTAFSLNGDFRHGYYISDVVVTLNSTDNQDGSGVLRTEYDLNDDNWRPYTTPFTLSEHGITTVRARSIDNASNQGVASQQVVNINKSAPISTIKSHFNNKEIAAGNWIWFNSVLKLKRDKIENTPVTIWFVNQMIEFQANGVKYNLPVPDSAVVFDPNCTTATTQYDNAGQIWVTTVPALHQMKMFQSGLAFQVPANLPKGINPVKWSGQFYTDTPGAKVDWKWAASVYTQFTSDYNALGVKPIGGDDWSDFDNRDHAGTPENFKDFAIDGARGMRGVPFKGQYSGTGHADPILW